ncbi:hypothetical protein SLEP1_g15281 [Rubroshorea leprosula]|uniref:Reverse transcriptase domain-containing protein n=1 Tax=Rubroshorea leprosula TaxID=152421 RepID=A0AAV5IYK6_9ROSI|nr:hypothetical protein SLEP1_g15281 [Rubroshorea leprosula]
MERERELGFETGFRQPGTAAVVSGGGFQDTDLWYSCWSYGKVADVYIPDMRDRKGRRFGFVRMAEVFDAKDMERKLNQIWLDSYRLKVKLAENMKSGKEGMARGRQQKQTEAQWVRRDRKVSPEITYAQIVAGKTKAYYEGESLNHVLGKKVAGLETKGAMSKDLAVIPISIPDQASTSVNDANTYAPKELVLQFSPREDEVAWLRQSRVASVRSLDMVIKIQNRLDVDGILVNVSLLGGRHVLLMDNSEGCLEEFIAKNRELMESWFEWIQPTLVSTMPSRNRLVWLRFNGVPLQAWSERCFLELAGLIGEVILVDDDTKSKSFLCEGQVLVLCDDTMKISQNITLMVDGESFLIKVLEEEWRMDPDWWLAGERRSSGMSLDVSDSESDNSADRYSEGDDIVVMAEDYAETEANSNLSLKQNVGLGPAGAHQKGAAGLVKKCKKLEDIHAGEGVAEEPREKGVQWVTTRTKCRKERRETARQLEEIHKLVKKENPDFLFLQETKLEEIEEALCRALWNSDNFDWIMQKSMGNSGGLLCIWNKSCFIKHSVIEGSSFIGVSGEWGKGRKICNVINVYAPCDRQRKVLLWEELAGRVLEEGGCWLLAGDFNAVRNVSERRGKRRETQDMQDFNHFVESTGLIDVGLRNRKFTWYRPDGSSMSRLDRFFMSTEMSLLATDWVQEGVARSVSDHCAIILKARNTDWGPKPFQVMDAWQQHPDFRSFVDDKWKDLQLEGWAAYKCKQKLKLMKDECKRWNKEVFGNVETRWEILSKDIEALDIKSEEIELDENEVLLRRGCFQEMWEILRKKEAMWKQKSRINWIRLGDAHTAFFHRCVHARRARNAMSSILGEDGWVEEPSRVKEEAVRYFSQLFHNEQWKRPVLGGVHFNRISVEQRKWLERPFSVEEIEEGLQSCDGTKMPDIISDSQSAFVGGRQLVDSVLVLNEVVDEVKQRKQESFIFKADFEKAYDCVDWNFLDWMMGQMGFGIRWRNWIHECLSTTRISILINGSPTKEFSVGKGLRQGDPLSPFLFLLVGEGLCGMVRKAEAEGIFRGVKIGEGGMVVSLLQFADDTVFMGKAKAENLRTVKAILHWFELISGLKINFCKSYLYGFNVTDGWLKGAADILHCKIGTSPFTYLGLPVGGISGRKKLWVSVLDRFRNKLATWKRSLLSFGGRITLLNSLRFREISLGVEQIWRGKLHGLGDGIGGLWKRVIWEKYYRGRKEVDITSFSSLHMSRVWKDIVGVGSQSERLGLMLGKGFKWEIGDGSRVAFWDDKAHRYGIVDGDEPVPGGLVRRKKAPKDDLLAEKWVRIVWCKLAPSKVSVFGWQLFLDRLATKDNLFKRGIALLGGM